MLRFPSIPSNVTVRFAPVLRVIVIRADKPRLYSGGVEFTLSSYGFPDNGTEIIRKSLDGAKAIILKGHDRMGREKQLAMTIYDGWDDLDIIESRGTNPDSERSIIIRAKTTRPKRYGNDRHMLISQVITKEDLSDFTEDDIFPIREISYTDFKGHGGYGDVTITLKNGAKRTVTFDGIEGNLSI